MLFSTINQFGLFVCGMFVGIILKVYFALFLGANKGGILGSFIDFAVLIVGGILYIAFNYLINYGDLQWFVIIGNILGYILSSKIFAQPIAKIKEVLYNRLTMAKKEPKK